MCLVCTDVGIFWSREWFLHCDLYDIFYIQDEYFLLFGASAPKSNPAFWNFALEATSAHAKWSQFQQFLWAVLSWSHSGCASRPSGESWKKVRLLTRWRRLPFRMMTLVLQTDLTSDWHAVLQVKLQLWFNDKTSPLNHKRVSDGWWLSEWWRMTLQVRGVCFWLGDKWAPHGALSGLCRHGHSDTVSMVPNILCYLNACVCECMLACFEVTQDGHLPRGAQWFTLVCGTCCPFC